MDKLEYDVAPADCVSIHNVEERAHENLTEKTVKEVFNTLKFSLNLVVRANRLVETNTNKDSKPRAIDLKLTSANDKKLIMSNFCPIKGSGFFIRPKLMWNDRQRKKIF